MMRQLDRPCFLFLGLLVAFLTTASEIRGTSPAHQAAPDMLLSASRGLGKNNMLDAGVYCDQLAGNLPGGEVSFHDGCLGQNHGITCIKCTVDGRTIKGGPPTDSGYENVQRACNDMNLAQVGYCDLGECILTGNANFNCGGNIQAGVAQPGGPGGGGG